MATHSSTRAWKIPWTEEPDRLVHGVTKSQTWLSNFTFTFLFYWLEKEMATHSRFLAWRIPGTGEPGGLPSMGLHRVGHDWSDLADLAVSLFGYKWESFCIQKPMILLQLACKTLLLCMEGKEIQSHQKSISPDIACRKSVESNSGAFHLDLVAAYVWTSVRKRWAYSHISGHMHWRHEFQSVPKPRKAAEPQKLIFHLDPSS